MTQSFSYTLQADPASPIPSAASTAAARAVTPRPNQKRGLLRPFRLDGKGGFARVTGDELLEQKLGNLLALDGLPWAPERTARLDELRHMASPLAFRAFAQAYAADAIRQFLPEVALTRMTVETAGPVRTITVEATKTNDRDAVILAALRR